MSNVCFPQPIVLKLSSNAHHWAKQFILSHNITNTGNEAYVKALIVWAVNEYLNQLKVTTNLDESRIDDAAELFVPLIGGVIACLPLGKVNEDITYIDVKHLMENQLYVAYLLVELSDELDMATILGYIPIDSDCIETIDLTKLQSISNFPNYLNKIKEGAELGCRLSDSGFLEDEDFFALFGELGTQLLEQHIPHFLFFAESVIIYRENIPTKEKRIKFKNLLLGKTTELLCRDIATGEIHVSRPGNKMISSRQRVPWLAKQWIDMLDRLKI